MGRDRKCTVLIESYKEGLFLTLVGVRPCHGKRMLLTGVRPCLEFARLFPFSMLKVQEDELVVFSVTC